jgi:diguanylate cyclase (GGDEF)-like protein/PAS domain S-box-containing protein
MGMSNSKMLGDAVVVPARDWAEPGLLEKIIDLLPVGVTVQDEKGCFVLVNSFAAEQIGRPAEALIGKGYADILDAERAAARQRWEADLIRGGRSVVVEENIPDPAGKQTYLTAQRPVRIAERALLITTSLDITERKRAEAELTRRAYFDDLTGLANRALLQDHVEEVLSRSTPTTRFAMAFIDLDNFKHINDYYSHAIGDALLVKVARRIAGLLGATDMLARISGDEFVLLVDPVASERELRDLVHAISESLRQPFHIESFEVFTSASIGVSLFPDHGRSYEVLRRNADSAMYRVKGSTKGGAALYDLDMGQMVTARMELEQRLRLAIRDRSFRCAFQPKVDLLTGDVMGLEALIRWCDEHGTISAPGNFIGLAVELGLIDPITEYMLAECVRSLDLIDASFGPQTTVSINVAAKQAGDLEFMRSFAGALEATGCADRFMLELTEDAFIAKGQFQTRVLPRLRDIGVRVSIDDFGTGFSSLSALADITADEVKVDRSFITDIHQRPRSQSVLKAIESLSHALGMSIVAEGVETFEELAYLKATTRIRYVQGYYFSRPFFIEDLSQARRTAGDRAFTEKPRERPEGRARAALRVGR